VNPDFVGDRGSGVVSSLTFHTMLARTVIGVNGSWAAGALRGTYLWVNKTAFLVDYNTENTITVYGDARRACSIGNAFNLQDYHLSTASLCIDAGTQASTLDHDYEGDPRPSNGGQALQVDIGADEFVGVRPPVESKLELGMCAALTITAEAGRFIRIEFLSDLTNTNSWKPLTNFVLPTSPYLFIDINSLGAAKRYYRAIVP
jgi:hypothetical protein